MAPGSARLALHLPAIRFCGTDMDCPVAAGISEPAASCKQRSCSFAGSEIRADSLGRFAEQRSTGHLPGVFLLRLLLVRSGHVAAGLSGDGSPLDHRAGGILWLAGVLHLWGM